MRGPRLPILGRRSPLRTHTTILDIGSDTIKALVVKREGDQGIVLGVQRVEQGGGSLGVAGSADLELIIEGCNAAIEGAEDMADAIPARAVIGLAGPDVLGFSTTVSRTRRKGLDRVTPREIDEHVALVQRRALREAQNLLADSGGEDWESVRLVHSALASIRIDGEAVSNPLHYQGERLDVSVFNAFAPAAQLQAVEAVARELDLELVAAVSEPYAMARAAATPETLELGAIFIDVGGGHTNVAVVRQGALEATRMVALGGHAFTRKLAADLGVPREQAEALKRRHADGQLSGEQRDRVHASLAEAAEVLAQGVALILHQMGQGGTLPATVRLCGGGCLLPELIEQLALLRWTEYLPFLQTPVFTRLSPEELPGIHDTTGLLASPADITPMGLAYQSVVQEERQGDGVDATIRRVSQAIGR